MLQVSS